MSRTLTAEEVKRLFPGASASTLRAAGGQAKKPEQREAAVTAPKQSVAQSHRPSGKTLCEVFTEEIHRSEFGGLNKTEWAYLQRLMLLKVRCLGVQSITLKLAHDCRFTPDFSYLDESGRLTLVDVKGFQREDALIKIKVAARTFPFFRFLIVKRRGKYGWDTKEVKP